MTSWTNKDGRMVPDSLPADFGTKRAIRDHSDLQFWAVHQYGKYVYCGPCGVAVPAARMAAHTADVHPRKAGAGGR